MWFSIVAVSVRKRIGMKVATSQSVRLWMQKQGVSGRLQPQPPHLSLFLLHHLAVDARQVRESGGSVLLQRWTPDALKGLYRGSTLLLLPRALLHLPVSDTNGILLRIFHRRFRML